MVSHHDQECAVVHLMGNSLDNGVHLSQLGGHRRHACLEMVTHVVHTQEVANEHIPTGIGPGTTRLSGNRCTRAVLQGPGIQPQQLRQDAHHAVVNGVEVPHIKGGVGEHGRKSSRVQLGPGVVARKHRRPDRERAAHFLPTTQAQWGPH